MAVLRLEGATGARPGCPWIPYPILFTFTLPGMRISVGGGGRAVWIPHGTRERGVRTPGKKRNLILSAS